MKPHPTTTHVEAESPKAGQGRAQLRGLRLISARLNDPETNLQLAARFAVFSLVTGCMLGSVATQVPLHVAIFIAMILGGITLPVLRRFVLVDRNYYMRVFIMLASVTFATFVAMEMADFIFLRSYSRLNWLAAWSATFFMNVVYVGIHLEHQRAKQLQVELESNRLRMLQGQINPHFVSNTLANISALIESDPPAAQNLLKEFANFMTDLVDFSLQETVLFADTLDVIETYLEIQRIRLGSRFTWEIDVPDELRWQRMLPMLTLPLIENAVMHGVNRITGPGWLKINATADTGSRTWAITVTNNGERSLAQTKSGHGIAINNIRQRLQIKFGSQAELRLFWIDDSTHCAVLKMPQVVPSATSPLRTLSRDPKAPGSPPV